MGNLHHQFKRRIGRLHRFQNVVNVAARVVCLFIHSFIHVLFD